MSRSRIDSKIFLTHAAPILFGLALAFSAGPVSAQPQCEGAVLADGSCSAQDTEALLEGAEEANAGAFDGGETGTAQDAGTNNSVPEAQTDDGGSFNVPTGGPASPLFGVQSFTQQMLRFEEFGPGEMPESYVAGDLFPAPVDTQSIPEGTALDGYLAQGMFPQPTRLANYLDEYPRKSGIEAFLGRALDTPPAEGRPPGEAWAH